MADKQLTAAWIGAIYRDTDVLQHNGPIFSASPVSSWVLPCGLRTCGAATFRATATYTPTTTPIANVWTYIKGIAPTSAALKTALGGANLYTPPADWFGITVGQKGANLWASYSACRASGLLLDSIGGGFSTQDITFLSGEISAFAAGKRLMLVHEIAPEAPGALNISYLDQTPTIYGMSGFRFPAPALSANSAVMIEYGKDAGATDATTYYAGGLSFSATGNAAHIDLAGVGRLRRANLKYAAIISPAAFSTLYPSETLPPPAPSPKAAAGRGYYVDLRYLGRNTAYNFARPVRIPGKNPYDFFGAPRNMFPQISIRRK